MHLTFHIKDKFTASGLVLESDFLGMCDYVQAIIRLNEISKFPEGRAWIQEFLYGQNK